ncbi:hypothetical protein Ae263Ps1_2196c [Pseudonocardia sp. Ae263_Ps1]|nr:hypothetical protein Ae263Ps1_2196c [Pseudonocardia sp. Ae263_Ps1]
MAAGPRPGGRCALIPFPTTRAARHHPRPHAENGAQP